MKNKYIIVLFLIGLIIVIFGALLKITHFQFGFLTGNLVLFIGKFIEVVAILIFIIKLFSDKNNSFLNR
jgi:hypothetical protein